MPFLRRGTVEQLGEPREGVVSLKVLLDDTGRRVSAVAFPESVGRLAAGDRVVVNTTGIDLQLGTGGSAFVLWNLSRDEDVAGGPGHIVKLRYTPWQMNVLAAEEQASAHHEVLRQATSLDGAPVVACGLHSQVAAVAAGIKARNTNLRVGYLMTDGGALPLSWSKLVRDLRAAGLIDVTATSGHAFGGDLEVVNVFSGLVALRHAASADVIVAGMGPGVVGTGTAVGFTAMEQGQLLDAATALGGRAIACLRISFADQRVRHQGVSHHSLTSLAVAAREPCIVAVPDLGGPDDERIWSQLRRARLQERHALVGADGSPALALLQDEGLEVGSMGRPMSEIPELFLSAGAAGVLAAEMASAT